MLDPQNTMERLETLKNKISELTQGYYERGSVEMTNAIIGYIEVLHLIPEIRTWIADEKYIWLSKGSSFTIPNIWTSYHLLDSVYNFYKKGIGKKPHNTYFLHEEFTAVHNQIIIYLHQLQLSGKQNMNVPTINFQEDASLLQIGDCIIKIAERREKTFPHQLLAYIFSHDWTLKFTFYDIMEHAFNDPENGNLRRCHTAAVDLRNKIKDKTNGAYSDFLIIGSGENGFVRINPKYIPK